MIFCIRQIALGLIKLCKVGRILGGKNDIYDYKTMGMLGVDK